MDNLEPITREETLLDGGDLTPITRKEMFIKRIYDKTQSVPEPITREEYFLAKAGEGSGGDVTIERLAVTENGTYSESGKAYSPVVVNVPAPPLPENAYLLNDLSDLPADIASFNDGTDLPMASLKVAVTPQQDLHGYDAPWAGGAGKNKFQTTAESKTQEGVTYTVNDDGTITVSGTATGYSSLGIGRARVSSSMGNITISGIANVTNIMWAECSVWDENEQLVVQITGGSQNPTLTFDLSSYTNAYYLTVNVKRNSNAATSGIIKPQVEVGSTATTFAPYSNICPIIGWDEATVGVSGINLFDKATIKDGYINDATGEVRESSLGAKCTDFTVVKANISYYIKTEQTSGVWGAWYDKNKTYIRGITRYANSVITAPSNAFYVRLTIFYNNSGNIDTFGINYPSTDTSYHAYNGATYTIDLDGTRYGGVVDVLNGTMDDTLDYIASYNGETLPSTWISDRDVYAEGTTPTIGAEVVYTRATPITVQLSPTQVKSLEGENNIFANCGQITEVKYFKKA